MERQGDEVHIETDEARGASSPNIVRWVLAISLFAAIALLSVIWIAGAASQSEEDQFVTVPDRSAIESTDSIVGEQADELSAAEPGDTASGAAAPTVRNEAADAPAAAEPAAN